MDNLTGREAEEAEHICDLENDEAENTVAFLLRVYDEAIACLGALVDRFEMDGDVDECVGHTRECFQANENRDYDVPLALAQCTCGLRADYETAKRLTGKNDA